MVIEQTLSIIKPDAVEKNAIGNIIARFEERGLRVTAAKMLYLNREQAESFYGIHRDKFFFQDMVEFMISGPILVQVLEGENAIAKNREIMGTTNPKEAAPGTIRRDFAKKINANAVHGSDAEDTAKREIAFFFKPEEIYSRG